MANKLYRDRVRSWIGIALQEFRDAEEVDHPGFKGRIRELAVSNIIKPLLFEHLAVGQGKITDYSGGQSAQVDCVVYSTRNLAPILYSESDGIFPVDAVLFAIEVKSTLRAKELREAYENATSLWGLRYSTGGYLERDGRREVTISPLIPALFAFATDLAVGGKSEFERYCELDVEAALRPTISMICVVGRGFWWYKYGNGVVPGRWIFHPPTDGLDEVIDFMAMLGAFAAAIQGSRPAPSLQPYLMNASIGEDGVVIRV
jgi:hypothetical protein